MSPRVEPWYASGPYSIDLPTRFGDKSIDRFDAGQSTAMAEYRGVAGGISNENQWWGPGIRNALILSNNAPGFPHAFVRTAHPVKTPIGTVEARLIIGGLTESHWFDTTANNNVRSLSAFAFSVRPNFAKNLVLGGARSVYATTTGWGRVPRNFLDAFSNVGRPNNRALGDSAVSPGGRDQIFSLFGRVVFPQDGFETYFEWARLEFPYSLRDALTAPNHSQGYTLGLQYARPSFTSAGRFRFQGELTSVEQSATWRDRPQGSFYTSRKVIQGYTQMGQPLGAAIGPGASSQWLAMDFIDPVGSFGIFAGRIRWNEDIHSTYGFARYQGYCIHVAEKLAMGDDEVSHLVVISIVSQLAFGAVGGVVFALSAPLLANYVFVIPPDMESLVRSLFEETCAPSASPRRLDAPMSAPIQ